MENHQVVNVTVPASESRDLLEKAEERGATWSRNKMVQVADKSVSSGCERMWRQWLGATAVAMYLESQGVQIERLYASIDLKTLAGGIDVRCAQPGKPWCSTETKRGSLAWEYKGVNWLVFCGLPEQKFTADEVVEIWGWITRLALLNRQPHWPSAAKWPDFTVYNVERSELQPIVALLPELGVTKPWSEKPAETSSGDEDTIPF